MTKRQMKDRCRGKRRKDGETSGGGFPSHCMKGRVKQIQMSSSFNLFLSLKNIPTSEIKNNILNFLALPKTKCPSCQVNILGFLHLDYTSSLGFICLFDCIQYNFLCSNLLALTESI